MEQILESLSVLLIPPFTDTLSTMLWSAFLAVLGVLLYLFYRRFTFGAALKLLLERGCTSPESALSGRELTKKKHILKALGNQDRLVVKILPETGETESTPEPGNKKSDLLRQTTRYYIPEDRQKKAAYFFKASSGKIWQIVLAVLGLYLALVVLYYLLPDLLNNLPGLK